MCVCAPPPLKNNPQRELLGNDPFFVVPRVLDELTTARVLATELGAGVPLDRCLHLPQELRDEVTSPPKKKNHKV